MNKRVLKGHYVEYVFVFIIIVSSCDFSHNSEINVEEVALKEIRNNLDDGSYEIYSTDNNGLRQGEYNLYYKNQKLQKNCFYKNDTIIGLINYYDSLGVLFKKCDLFYENGIGSTNQLIHFNQSGEIDSLKSCFISVNGDFDDSIKISDPSKIAINPVVKNRIVDSIFYKISCFYEDGTDVDTSIHMKPTEFIFCASESKTRLQEIILIADIKRYIDSSVATFSITKELIVE
jgi:hypothetical protein